MSARKNVDCFVYCEDRALLLILYWYTLRGFPGSLAGKESACSADLGLIPGSGRSPGGGHGSPLRYSRLEHPIDRGAWWAPVYGVTESDTTKRLGTPCTLKSKTDTQKSQVLPKNIVSCLLLLRISRNIIPMQYSVWVLHYDTSSWFHASPVAICSGNIIYLRKPQFFVYL